jgi:hypothetical protein
MYYNSLNKNELIDLCRKKGLSSTGNKPALVSRLLKAETTETKKTDMFTQDVEVELDVKPPKTAKDEETFYLHLKSSNLANYFNFGYFYPLVLEESEIYKNENRAKDILSEFEDYIIVGKTPFSKFDISDVLIEFVLNGINAIEHESSGLFYIAEPIPVSRVKTIYFKTAAAKALFLSSIKTFPDSFIPNSVCDIISIENEKAEEIDFAKIKLPKNEKLFDWKEKLDLFDKILGLFAFIKNASIFYAEKENRFENYSAGFFSALNLINPIKPLSSYKENVFLRPLIHYRNLEINNSQRVIFKSVVERVYENKTFDSKTAINILENSIANEHSKNGELADIKEEIDLFTQWDKGVISYKGLLQKDVLRKNQNIPTLALLFLSKFPNKSRQNTDKQAVRNSFIENEFSSPLNIAEYALGFLGLYYGYKNMIKEDTNLKFSDTFFEQLASKSQSIKFKLEGYFERFVIESAFQFSVNQIVLNDTFDFLNWNNETSESKLTSIPSSFQYEYSDKSFYLLGQKFLSIQRQDKTEKVFENIANQYSDKIENTNYLFAFFNKYFQLDKWHILDILKKNKSRYPMEELEDVIDLDKRSKKK